MIEINASGLINDKTSVNINPTMRIGQGNNIIEFDTNIANMSANNK